MKLIHLSALAAAIFGFMLPVIPAEKNHPITLIPTATGSGPYVIRRAQPVPKTEAGQPEAADRWDEQTARLKKISDQRLFLRRISEAKREAEQIRTLWESSSVPPPRLKTLLGRPLPFYEGPSVAMSTGPVRSAGTATSTVLVNGKTRDTVSLNDPFTLSMSLAGAYASVRLNIYADVDNDGMMSERDIPLTRNAYLFDNSDDDADPAIGAFRIDFPEGNAITYMIASIVFEVDDHQSVSTASLTIRQGPSSAVVKGTIEPARANVMLAVLRTPDAPLICLTDSAGAFSFSVDRRLTAAVTIRPASELGTIPGYLPPSESPIPITSDTSIVVYRFMPATSFIDGYVRDQGGNPIPNVKLRASGPLADLMTYTDSAGHYTIGVSEGRWYLYSEIEWTNEYLTKTGTTTLSVFPNETTQRDIYFIRSNSMITGRVLYGASGIGGIPISVQCDTLSNEVMTQRDGRYTVPVYKPSTGTQLYAVQTTAPTGYYAMIPSRNGIAAGAADIDFLLFRMTGGLEGRVVDDATGAPVSHARLYFYGTDHRSTSTNDTGYFRVTLRNDVYTLYSEATPYYRYSEAGVTTTDVFSTKTIRLRRCGSFSGTVTDEQGGPIRSVTIIATDSTGINISYSKLTDKNGTYCTGNLMTGNFYSYASVSGYASVWYRNTYRRDSATLIRVTDGTDTPNIDFVLGRGGSIAGTVRDPEGKPIRNIEVFAFDSLYFGVASSTTNDSGAYVLTGLPPGTYKLQTNDRQDRYCDQMFGGTTDPEYAARVIVAMNMTAGNINFTLHRGGTILGSLHDAKGNGIPSAQIQVLDSTFMGVTGYGTTDGSGDFTISKLEPYKKYFVMARKWYNTAYVSQWYDHASMQSLASPIAFVPGEVKRSVDFTLSTGGGITGKVTARSGYPMQYAFVSVEDTLGLQFSSAACDASGKYSIDHLPNGTYYVHASTPVLYVDQWYDHKRSRLSADPVVVAGDAMTSNIDFALDPVSYSDSVIVRIKLGDIPDSLIYNQPNAADTSVDYWWGVRFDADSNSSTGERGCEIELACLHDIYQGAPQMKATLVDGTSHMLIAWKDKTGYGSHYDVSARIDPSDKNTLILCAPRSWSEINCINANTKYYFHTMYAGPDGLFEDLTPVITGRSPITDPAGDVPYPFIDIVASSALITSVPSAVSVPSEFRLEQNFPNPFNPATTIRYALPAAARVRLAVYDVLGREVARLVDDVQSPGWKTVEWKASLAASGIYFYRLTAGSYVHTKRMVVVK